MPRLNISGSAKKGVSASGCRSRREAAALSIRKDKREENLMKRRQAAPVEAWGESTSNTSQDSKVEESKGSEETRVKFTVSDFPSMVSSMIHGDAEAQLTATRGFRRLLSAEKNPPVQECIDAGAVPLFVKFLQRVDNRDILFEAAWALTNIASTDYTSIIVEAGAVSHLVKLLLHGDADVRDQSAWCLGNVAGDSPELRDVVLSQQGAMDAILTNLAQPANQMIMRNCTWTLSNFCRGKPQPPLALLAPCLPALAHLISKSNDVDTMVDACWALSYISDGDNDRILAVVQHGVIPALITMMSSDQTTQIIPALRTIGNIVSGNDMCTQAVVDSGFLNVAGILLSHSKKNIRKETCWALSNIAAGSIGQLQALMTHADVIRGVLEALSQSSEWEVRKEAAWVVSNIATSGQPGHLQALIENGVIQPLCDILEVGDSKVLMVGLEAIESILKLGLSTNNESYAQMIEDCSGVEKLENLQEHKSEDVYQKVVTIIEQFFNGEEEDDQNIIPQTASNSNTYTFGLPTEPTGKFANDFGSSFEQSINTQPFNFTGATL